MNQDPPSGEKASTQSAAAVAAEVREEAGTGAMAEEAVDERGHHRIPSDPGPPPGPDPPSRRGRRRSLRRRSLSLGQVDDAVGTYDEARRESRSGSYGLVPASFASARSLSLPAEDADATAVEDPASSIPAGMGEREAGTADGGRRRSSASTAASRHSSSVRFLAVRPAIGDSSRSSSLRTFFGTGGGGDSAAAEAAATADRTGIPPPFPPSASGRRKSYASAFLPNVGIVSVSGVSAEGVRRGLNLAVLDLASGSHFFRPDAAVPARLPRASTVAGRTGSVEQEGAARNRLEVILPPAGLDGVGRDVSVASISSDGGRRGSVTSLGREWGRRGSETSLVSLFDSVSDTITSDGAVSDPQILHRRPVMRRSSITFRTVTSGGNVRFPSIVEDLDSETSPRSSFRSDSSGDSSSFKGLDPIEAAEERMAPHSLGYLPQILRESYACPNAEVRNRARMIKSESGAAAAAAIELRMRLRRPRALPECREVHGSVLILDLSGFTALGERLKKEQGDAEGAAEFADRVNSILSTMVEHVYTCGGDVLFFAGDALICLFEERFDRNDKKATGVQLDEASDAREVATVDRIHDCCLRVLRSPVVEDKDFKIHGGSAHGLLRCYYLGTPSTKPGDCTFVVSGKPLQTAGHLLDRASSGQILVNSLEKPITDEDAKNTEDIVRLVSARRGPNFARRSSWTMTAMASVSDVRNKMEEEMVMNHDVHPFGKAYLPPLAARSIHNTQNGMSILLNELRPVAIVFVGLHDFVNVDAHDVILLRKMNSVFLSMSRITHNCDGAVKEMSFDDKGCVFISIFGAQSHGVNPCFDATMCAMRMQDALRNLDLKNFSLGVSFGNCFCGEVGPAIRKSYVVMGTEVNTASRLMGKAPRQGILVSKRIFENSKAYIRFVKSDKIKVKGIDQPFHAYIPQDRIVHTLRLSEKEASDFIVMPSRQIDMKTMTGALEDSLDGEPKLAMVCGGPFLGKSRIIREVMKVAKNSGFTVLQSFRTSLDCFTSYFPFKEIALTALQACAMTVAKAEATDEVDAVKKLVDEKLLTKTDRMMIGSVIPSISDAQLISLLPKNPKILARAIVESFIKLLKPLQPVMLVFEGDGEIDPSSWNVMTELLAQAVKQCPQVMLVISSRNAPTVPSTLARTFRDNIVHVQLAPFEQYETEIYIKYLLNAREQGIGIDKKMLDLVHTRANGCPQFIEYIVRWALDKGLIENLERHNIMSFKSLDSDNAHTEDDIIPRELSSIVLSAFNNLTPKLWDALKFASCIGYSFDADVYKALTGDVDFIPKIKHLAASFNAFERTEGNRYKWKHQAVYEAVKSLLVKSQREKIHSIIVEAFERTALEENIGALGKGDVHRLLARHCSLANKWDSAFNQYMEAGKRAEETHNFSEAASMYEEALETQEKMVPKPLLRSRLLPSVNLGNCLRELAKYTEAEEVLTQCLTEAERAMQEIDGDEQLYVHVLTSLATLYRAESKYEDARKLYEEALPIARNIQESRSSLWLAGQIAGYAEILRKSGDLVSAEALHREALDIRNLAAEGGVCTELELAISFTQLGCTLFGLKRYYEAYSKHGMALYSRTKYLDFTHGLVSESLNYCAESLCSLDRGSEGIPLAMHAVYVRKIVFGTSHPAYAHALSVLASCYHACDRSDDACDFLEECIDICEHAFPKNHANMIPNLMNYGKVLRSTGHFRQARDIFERAITIHRINFKGGQRAAELEKCTQEVAGLHNDIAVGRQLIRHSFTQSKWAINNGPSGRELETAGSPVIVVTDVGRDVDDEYCLVLMSALTRMHLLNPIAVITTLAPEKERAHLARGILDSLGFPDVPIGIGSAGGVVDGVELELYGSAYSRSSSYIVDDGVELMAEALASALDSSVQLLIIASFTDVAALMKSHEQIFGRKVKEVVVMGGLKPFDEALNFIEPDTAYNNNCDMDAAKYVYKRCQELRIPTLTISRHAAYGCPVSVSVLQDLCKTQHMVAHNIKKVSVDSINQLWKKVNLTAGDPRREKLPSRCDRTWFCHTFFGLDDVVQKADESIWPRLKNLNMYDPLALMACVPAYRDNSFVWETKFVNGTPHRIAGTSDIQTGIVDAEDMSNEMANIFSMAFRSSLENICTQTSDSE